MNKTPIAVLHDLCRQQGMTLEEVFINPITEKALSVRDAGIKRLLFDRTLGFHAIANHTNTEIEHVRNVARGR